LSRLTILLALTATLCGCKKYSPPPPYNPPVASWNDSLRQELRIVCLEGHEYYYSAVNNGEIGGSYSVLAPKLTDDGKPVRCTTHAEKVEKCE
jgi:hypothetical protein